MGRADMPSDEQLAFELNPPTSYRRANGAYVARPPTGACSSAPPTKIPWRTLGSSAIVLWTIILALSSSNWLNLPAKETELRALSDRQTLTNEKVEGLLQDTRATSRTLQQIAVSIARVEGKFDTLQFPAQANFPDTPSKKRLAFKKAPAKVGQPTSPKAFQF